jgi:hypothetical protein
LTFQETQAATRVNAQGLVENVQILSGDLVSNGDFSQEGAEEVSNGSFSQEGAEQVTNGDFATDSDWTLLGGWSIANGKLTANNATGYALQSGVFESGVSKTYKINLSVSDYVSGYFTILTSGGTSQSQQFNANGDYTIYFDSNSPSGTTLHFTYFGSFTGSIDNVSVKEVGQDWTLGAGWSIGEDKVICDGTNSPIDQYSVTTIGKTYKVDITVADMTTASINIRLGTSSSDIIGSIYANGTYTFYGTVASSTTFRIRSADGFDGSITNISVKEVGQDWTLNDWSIGDSLASSGNTSSLLRQDNIFTSTTSIYKTTFKAKSVNGSSVTLRVYDGSGNNFETITITSSDFQDFELTRQRQGANASLYFFNNSNAEIEVTNISVVEITDDTNLPRINYEGFSYQDSLGSEEVTNGDFATDLSGWNISGNSDADHTVTWTSQGARYQSTTTSPVLLFFQNVLTSGKTYKFTVDVAYTSGAIKLQTGSGANLFNPTLVEGTNTFYFTASNTQFLFIRSNTNVDVLIDNVSVKEYLGQEVVPDSGCGSWLLEPQSTNLVTYSEDFSDAFWLIQNASVTLNNAISPDGTLSATKLIENTSNSIHRILNGAGLTVSGNVSMSIFAKKGERNWIRLTNNNIQGAFFDLDNGVVGAVIFGINAKIENYGNGWWKCSISQTGVANERLGVYTSIDGVNTTYQGDGTSGVYIWGAMLEQQSYATSYIPTNGAASTRLQDLANNSGNATLINSTEGVLYAEIAALSDDLNFRTITLSDGTTNNNVGFGYRNNSNVIYTFLQGVINSSSIVTVSDITSVNKVAIKYKSGDFSMFVNGIKVFTSTTAFTLTGLNELAFDNGAGAANFHGKAKALVVYKEALTDEQLICLTTI